MRIAILGATSQIAKDLVLSFSADSNHELVLFARRPEVLAQWLVGCGTPGKHAALNFAAFDADQNFEAVINFVGVGDPAQAAAMGSSIFDVTLKYDELALDYLRQHPECRYIFLSSGAAYGSKFDEPVTENTKAVVSINSLQPQDWYGAAKMHAECRHRATPNLPIVDVRVFNYFSHTQDISARFLITDIIRAIRDNVVLQTSPDYIVRDFIHPSDFFKLIAMVLEAPPKNVAIDCYSLAPIDKAGLLMAMEEKFGLQYEITEATSGVNATGIKPYYYSTNMRAADFGYQPKLTSLDGIVWEFHSLRKLCKLQPYPEL